ncbi:hypothetical protein [Rhodococcus sp. NCIMB 12038]|uniref:hypothetical protein n=1 Tax=Rhodococcus sp. NCIMB 12038 TaxID=933800 RepID=UPI000B3CB611|nr:hypothetical protein [Rhodococcus sp. NCIMB 12038]OUS97424.1 hypothetical protein CA951_03525 [Rhodococcus sp. NCIMB 12038]
MTTPQVENGVAVGSGSGWLLIDNNASGGSGRLPAGFASTTEPGSDDVVGSWERGGFQAGILWLHQTSRAAVLAVPSARWQGSGTFLFFLWRGFGSVLKMPAWYAGADWTNNSADFHAAHAAAQAFGGSALGIEPRPA